MTFEHVAYAVEDGVLTITLDRPDQLNAFTGRMCEELIAAFDAADADDDVRAIVVTGAGRAFCAGADLAAGGDTFRREPPAPGQVNRDRGGLVTLRIFDSLKPVIAAVNGAAVGVGLTMTLPMDVRLVADGAKLGFVFARRGLVPEAASSWFLPRLVGVSRAMEWCCSGRFIPPEEARAAGLVRDVHAPDALLPAAYALAHELGDAAAPMSVALTRRMLWRGLTMAHPMEAHRADSRAVAARGASADIQEGVEAFLHKREAHFPDRVSDGLPDVFPDWAEPEFG